MSLPRLIPSKKSPTPSKSSLRRPSNPQAPSTPKSLLPSPHFEEPVPGSPRLFAAQSREIPQHEDAIEQGSLELRPRPQFGPFFTLISDDASGEYLHPSVHYVFADDDAEIVTEAALRSLQRAEAVVQHSDSETENTENTRVLPSRPNTREHYLVLDIAPGRDGVNYEVTKAQSLSSEWQILRTSIANAPTIDVGDGLEDAGLMLKIEGRGNTPPEQAQQKGAKSNIRGSKEKEAPEQLIERFQLRLKDLRRTMDVRGTASTAAGVSGTREEEDIGD